MPAPESPPARNFADLSAKEKITVRRHFAAACVHRAKQWDEELAIEAILGRDIDVDFSDWAPVIGDADEAADNPLLFDEADVALSLDPS